MQVKRLAVPVLVALGLAACSSDSSTGPGGTSTAQRIAAYEKFSTASSNAIDAGAYDAGVGFLFAGVANLFGSGTTSVSVSSNGMASLMAADSKPAYATAGSYQLLALSIRSIDDYGSSADTSEQNLIIAYRDTTDLIVVSLDGTTSGTFGDDYTYGTIYHSPSAEWWATTGSASLTNMQLGSACQFDSQIQAVIDANRDANETYTCNTATFNGSVNITDSDPAYFDTGTNNATGSRTASFSKNGIPGLRITDKYTYSAR